MRSVLPALLTGLLALASAPAFAQAPGKGGTGASGGTAASDKPTDPDARARARFKEGVAFAKKNEWQRAYAALSEAWSLKQHPQIALNLGRAEMEVGKYRDSTTHLRYCVKNADPKDPDLKLCKQWLTEAEKKVSRLAITADVAGVEILVDGETQGNAPLPDAVLVDPGKHEITIRRDAVSERRIVEVSEGKTLDVSLEVGKEERLGGPTPPPQVIEVEHPRPWRTPALITGGSLTLVGLVLGGVSLGLTFDKAAAREQAGKDPRGRDAYMQAAEDEALFQNLAVWSFVGAGIAAGATGAVFFLTRDPAKPKVQGSLGFTRGGPSLSIWGEF